METCIIKGCDSAVFVKGKGLCSRHYNRLRTTGTVVDGGKARASLGERLWRQVERRGPDECWPWTAKSLVRGYGFIGRGGRGTGKLLAHRAAWEVTHGPIPQGEGAHGTVVMHTCDNRLCCNPAHLKLGTQADNVRDMDAKGRRVNPNFRGAAHPNSKLTEEDVRAIRASTEPYSVIAARYGIHTGSVKNLRLRKSWKHLD